MRSHLHSFDDSISSALVEASSQKTADGISLFPCLNAIREIAVILVAVNDGVLLGGGTSIHPSFYAEEDASGESKGFYDADPRRTLLGFFFSLCLQN
jgi:hypothetical protein